MGSLFSACRPSRAPRDAGGGASRKGPGIVFILGHKGSVIKHRRTGQTGWFDVLGGINMRTPDLRMPLEWDGDVQKGDDWVEGGPLMRVAHVDVYQRFLRWLRPYSQRQRGFEPKVFSYDWRRDMYEHVGSLISFLEEASSEFGGPPQVLAHSLGGQIAWVALNERPDLFHSCMFLTTPFGYGSAFLADLNHGVLNGYNVDIVGTGVCGSSASSYQIGFPLPWEDTAAAAQKIGGNECAYAYEGWINESTGEVEERKPVLSDASAGQLANPFPPALLDDQGQRIEHDFFSADFWEKHGLGPFAFAPFVDGPGAVKGSSFPASKLANTPEGLEAQRECVRDHMRHALARGKHFRHLMLRHRANEPGFDYPPIGAVLGTGRDTRLNVILNGPESVRGVDLTSVEPVNGDGRLGPLHFALPPGRVPCRRCITTEEHWRSVEQVDAIEALADQLVSDADARKSFSKGGVEVQPAPSATSEGGLAATANKS